jgi:hypothetical protein
VWSEYAAGIAEPRVVRLDHDGGRTIDSTTLATTFFASTAGDGIYRNDIVTSLASPLSVTTTSLPNGLLRESYAQSLAAAGGTPPYFWSLVGGALPPGLELDNAEGTIGGEPGLLGLWDATLQVSDTFSQVARRAFTLRITGPPPVIQSCSPAALALGLGGTVRILGSLFKAGATVDFGAGLVVTETSFVTANELQATLATQPAAQPGPRTVTVRNPDYATSILPQCLTLVQPLFADGFETGNLSRWSITAGSMAAFATGSH